MRLEGLDQSLRRRTLIRGSVSPTAGLKFAFDHAHDLVQSVFGHSKPALGRGGPFGFGQQPSFRVLGAVMRCR